ncbi:hypothetical protein LY76DRAFT_306457 [Colletotrichum caudatum]|nr:hypothetical protein LY76DRAFT_306457 [Colletotrichum caudatum]
MALALFQGCSAGHRPLRGCTVAASYHWIRHTGVKQYYYYYPLLLSLWIVLVVMFNAGVSSLVSKCACLQARVYYNSAQGHFELGQEVVKVKRLHAHVFMCSFLF